LRPAKELPVVLSVGETEVMVIAGDRPLDRGPLARSEIRRVGPNEFLLLIEGRGWQIRVDNAATFMREVMPRFGQGRFARLRAWRVSWFGLRDPADGTLRVTPWAVVTSLAWVVVLVMGFGLGRLETGVVAGLLTGVAVAGVAFLGLRWARLVPRAQKETSSPAPILRSIAPEPVAHSAITVGMAGDVDLVREILGDRLSGKQRVAPVAPPSTARRVPPGSIPAPPIGGVSSGVRQPMPAQDLPATAMQEVEDLAPVWAGRGATSGETITDETYGEASPPSGSRAESPEPASPGDEGETSFLLPEPDDLTTIRGIGPRLAARLAGVGVVTFRQLADLGEAEIARLQAELGTFIHRMEKDRWQEQAREAHARKYGG
jgi:predicted flap endonuclease-1-like 5' DNA nuclease